MGTISQTNKTARRRKCYRLERASARGRGGQQALEGLGSGTEVSVDSKGPEVVQFSLGFIK